MEQERRQKALRVTMTNPYYEWIYDEVAYIITAEEIAAFKKLATDPEREQFIVNFWERRNPEPGNPENKFRQEYYRRIIFANQHFSTDVQGRQTDRGRIYIQFGPPDSIDANLTGGTTIDSVDPARSQLVPIPAEIWHYRCIDARRTDVDVVFADPANTGDYRLILDSSPKDVLLYSPQPEVGSRFGGDSGSPATPKLPI